MHSNTIPYWRLSSFYFFYFAVVGTVVPFVGLYLQSLDYSPQEIAYIAAILLSTRIVAPNIWGWLCDKTGHRVQIIRIGCFLACLCFVIPLFRTDFWWMAFAVASFSFFWNAVLAQFEVLTLGHLGDRVFYYSRIRMWGSIGFIVVVVGLGAAFDVISLSFFPVIAIFFMLLIWLSSLSISDGAVERHSDEGHNFLSVVWQRPVICFLLASFFLQLSHGSYYTFYSVMLESLGFSRLAIGGLWALGVVAEVVIFLLMHRLLTNFSLRNLLLLSLGLAALRWLLIGYFSSSITVLIFAQCLHAFSFGTAHSVSIEFTRRYFKGRTQGQGQALYSAVSFGAGGAVGALVSGLTWTISSSVSFYISALAAVLAFLVVFWGLRSKA